MRETYIDLVLLFRSFGLTNIFGKSELRFTFSHYNLKFLLLAPTVLGLGARPHL